MSVPADAGLNSLGVTLAEQRVYVALLEDPALTPGELGEREGLDEGGLRRLLRSLVDKGLLVSAHDVPAQFAAAPPEIAIEILALRRLEEVEHARLAGAALADRVCRRSTAASTIQVAQGHEAIAHRFQQVQRLATQELLILDKPPYVAAPDVQHDLQRELQGRGVRYRTIYDREALEMAGELDDLRQLAAAGEEARVLAGVPMKLLIADRRIGLVPHDQPGDHQVMLVRSSALLDGLISLFDALWAQATPLWPHGGPVRVPTERRTTASGPLSADDQQLLALLAAGLTDQAIARKLGVAQRTVERRVRRVMDGLGARTRFQAGLQAASRGHLQPDAIHAALPPHAVRTATG